jgi:phosphohistidine phosphatase SixA
MTGELYVVRHAEAAGAEQSDPGLSDRGRAPSPGRSAAGWQRGRSRTS